MKKLLSIVLALCLLVSLCTMAITSVSAEEVTIKDLGVTDGDIVTLYDDPTGTGEKVLRLYTAGSRPNFELADPTNGEVKFEPVAGTNYTVMFDYYFNEKTTAGSPFTLYYGAQSKYSANYSKVEISGYKSGFDSKFIGDGEWHTGAISFNAAAKTGKVNGVTGQVLPYLYLTYYAGNTDNDVVDGYIKNIRIVTETGAQSYSMGKYDLKSYFDESGNKIDSKFSGGKGQASTTLEAYLDTDGTPVFIPNNDVINATGSGQVNSSIFDWVEVATADGSSINAVNPYNYTVTVKYKVLELGSSGYAAIGFGRTGATAGQTTHGARLRIDSVSDDWEYYTGTFYPNTSTAKLRICLSGTGSKIAIDTIQVISVSNTADKVSIFYYNDNGNVDVFPSVGYVGTDLLRDDGANADNLALGEKFLGWYDDANYSNATTKVTASGVRTGDQNSNGINAYVYAKYPTTIIDFDHFTGFHSGYGINSSCTANMSTTEEGVYKVKFANNVGIVYPAYDAIKDDRKDSDAYYKFADGETYHITYVYKADLTATYTQTLATHAGSAGAREIASDSAHTKAKLTAATDWNTVSVNITFKYAEGFDHMVMRPQSGNDPTVEFDKITITDLSLLEAQTDKELVSEGSIRPESGEGEAYVSAGIRFKGRVSESFRESATEIGFYAVPTAALGDMSIVDYLATEDNIAITAKVLDTADETMEEIVYKVNSDNYGRKSYDYQLIITGLTREGVEANLLDTEITCIMYAVVGGEVVYTNTQAYCYNDVANK